METKNTPDLATGPCDLCGTADSARWWSADAKGKPPTLFGHAKLCDACHRRGRGALERLMAGALQLSIEAVEGMAGRLEVGLKGGIDGMIAARRAARPPGVPSTPPAPAKPEPLVIDQQGREKPQRAAVQWAPPILEPHARIMVDPHAAHLNLVNMPPDGQVEAAEHAHRDMWASTFEERPRPIPVPRHEPAVVATAVADQRAAVEAEVRGQAADVIAALRGTYEARLDRLEKNVAEFAGWIIKQGADKALDGTPGLLRLLAGRIAEVEGELRDWGAGVNQRLLELEAAKVKVSRVAVAADPGYVTGPLSAEGVLRQSLGGEELGGSRAKIRDLERKLKLQTQATRDAWAAQNHSGRLLHAMTAQRDGLAGELETVRAAVDRWVKHATEVEHERDGYREQLATSEEETAIAERRAAELDRELCEVKAWLQDVGIPGRATRAWQVAEGKARAAGDARPQRVMLEAAAGKSLDIIGQLDGVYRSNSHGTETDDDYRRRIVAVREAVGAGLRPCSCSGGPGQPSRPCNIGGLSPRWHCVRLASPGRGVTGVGSCSDD